MSQRNSDNMHTRSGLEDARVRMAPDSLDETERTLDVVWSAGADVTRCDWATGERYTERLSMDPEHVNIERLQSGAPLLDSHRSQGAANVLGAIVPGSVRVADGLGIATVRLTDAPDVASTVRKIMDGSIRNLSVGYRIHGESREMVDGVEIRTATSWEPYEVSAVAVPADAGAQVRELERATPQENNNMSNIQDLAPVSVDVEAERAAAIADERKRVAAITASARALGLAEKGAELVAAGATADAARAALIDARAEADESTRVDSTIRVGSSHADQVRAGITNAVEHRLGLSELTDAGRAHRHMSLVQMARTSLDNAGTKTSGLSDRDVVRLAMAPQPGAVISRDYEGNIRALGGHTAADFPFLLANVANKSLLPGYAAEPLNFLPLVQDRALPDFKTASVVNLGRITSMPQKIEGAEYQRVTIGESREQYSLATYGSTIGFSREMMINDDLGGLQIAIREMGSVWARTQLDLFWAVITANANMADSNPLFGSAHANEGTGAALSKAALAEMRQLLREQRGVESSSGAADGQYLNLTPAHLIVPTDLEQTAEDLMGMGYDPTTVAAARPGWVGSLSLIVEPRLGASSATAYYLAAARAFCERGLLGGSDAPYIDSFDEWSTDEMVFKVRGDVAFKATDWRPITYNDGTP